MRAPAQPLIDLDDLAAAVWNVVLEDLDNCDALAFALCLSLMSATDSVAYHLFAGAFRVMMNLDYSILMPAALMTRDHLGISARTISLICSGVVLEIS